MPFNAITNSSSCTTNSTKVANCPQRAVRKCTAQVEWLQETLSHDVSPILFCGFETEQGFSIVTEGGIRDLIGLKICILPGKPFGDQGVPTRTALSRVETYHLPQLLGGNGNFKISGSYSRARLQYRYDYDMLVVEKPKQPATAMRNSYEQQLECSCPVAAAHPRPMNP